MYVCVFCGAQQRCLISITKLSPKSRVNFSSPLLRHIGTKEIDIYVTAVHTLVRVLHGGNRHAATVEALVRYIGTKEIDMLL